MPNSLPLTSVPLLSGLTTINMSHTPSIPTGTYIITSTYHNKFATLTDKEEATPITGGTDSSTPAAHVRTIKYHIVIAIIS
jgi:hypothetical protein